MIKRTVNLNLTFQPPIERPPVSTGQMFQQVSQSDDVTVKHWRKIWVRNIAENKKRFGSFKNKGIHQLYNQWKWRPAICIGSGPSLRYNIERLKAGNNGEPKFILGNPNPKYKEWAGNPGIPVISCLHNFAYLEDLGIHVDYYVTLDAGEVVIDEFCEGGKEKPEHYIELSKNRKLLCYTATNPRLFDRWHGDVCWFNSIIPDNSLKDEMDLIELYHPTISSGGNVLGACFYAAKTFFGANPIIFTGADFSFGYDHQFHSWSSSYDTLGNPIWVRDIFGNRVPTWQSYYQFKTWFDLKAVTVPGVYINATEGGCMGAYETGNIVQIQQTTLDNALEMYRVSDHVKETMENPDKPGHANVIVF